MADTNAPYAHDPAEIPVESDGISYRGLFWFTAFLVVSALIIHGFVFGLLRLFEYTTSDDLGQRPALAGPALQAPPQPNLLSMQWPAQTEDHEAAPPTLLGPDEPTNLKRFRESEEQTLDTYGWVDRNAGTVRIPIERAKELLLERGLPVRGQAAAAEGIKK